jgi:hypothetical protein
MTSLGRLATLDILFAFEGSGALTEALAFHVLTAVINPVLSMNGTKVGRNSQ